MRLNDLRNCLGGVLVYGEMNVLREFYSSFCPIFPPNANVNMQSRGTDQKNPETLPPSSKHWGSGEHLGLDWDRR